MTTTMWVRLLPFVLYVVLIAFANWATVALGVIPVPFGLMAPAGVYAAGLTFAARNFTQQSLGRRFGFAAIGVGAVLSYALTDKVTIPGGIVPLAIASGVTFALSETVDALFWTPLKERGWSKRAMLAGEAAGQVVDSVIFLTLAFGSAELLLGQITAKWLTIVP